MEDEMQMGPEIIKKVEEEREKAGRQVQLPLELPISDIDTFEDEDVSIVSSVITIDLA